MPTDDKTFPLVKAAKNAHCFQCFGNLRGSFKTENAPGRGQFKGYCDKCECWTWYDIEGSHAD